MSELPRGWAACTLGDIVERIETGKSVKCDERPPQGTENGLVKISAVTWGEFDEQESKTLFDSSHLKPEEKIQLGDFLISRANTLELVGSCVMVKKISKNLYLSDKVLRLVLPDEAKSWLLVCLRSQAGRKQIENLATGNQLSMRNISQQALREIRMPLPPFAEQTRIAAKLDELLAQVDTMKARIDGIPALLKRFRQSVLAAAVSGRLTEKWRRAHGVDSIWNKVAIDSVCSAAFDGPFGSKLKSDDYTSEGVRVVRLENIGHLSFIGEKETFISLGKFEELSKNKLEAGDILFSSFVDEEIRVCQLPESGEIFINKADCFCLRIDQEAANPVFVMYALAARRTYRQIREAVHGATRPRINLGFLKGFEISLPSPTEQTEIVRRVEQLFAFADQLEAKVNEAKTRIDRLTQSILAKAFRGELVPQDPNDEPASRLLERIQAQRTNAPKARQRRKA